MEKLSQRPGIGLGADVTNVERREGIEAAPGVGQGPVAFKTSFKTAIVNRKSAMLLLSQVRAYSPADIARQVLPYCVLAHTC